MQRCTEVYSSDEFASQEALDFVSGYPDSLAYPDVSQFSSVDHSIDGSLAELQYARQLSGCDNSGFVAFEREESRTSERPLDFGLGTGAAANIKLLGLMIVAHARSYRRHASKVRKTRKNFSIQLSFPDWPSEPRVDPCAGVAYYNSTCS